MTGVCRPRSRPELKGWGLWRTLQKQMDDPVDTKNTQLAEVEASWERNYHRVVAYSVRRGFEPSDAEEIAAEAFTIAYKKGGRGSLDLPWLLAAARRVASNRRRSENRRTRLLERLRREGSEPPQVFDAGDGLVAEAFASLSNADREVLALIAWDGLEPREAAAVLGVSPGAVSVRIHRAKARLRRELAAATGRQDRRGPSEHDLSEVTE